jgi:hypothetical protein
MALDYRERGRALDLSGSPQPNRTMEAKGSVSSTAAEHSVARLRTVTLGISASRAGAAE